MTVPPTESGEGDPGQLTRIAEEFFRLREAGKLTDLDEFCGRYPEDQRQDVRNCCEELLRIHGVIKQPNQLIPGQMLASYRIVEQIGKGGMGEVYRATDGKLDRDIAIKVLPPELACQPERVKRFKREAKAIAALDHPNIVTIHSVEESEGLHFITMQLVQGKTLSESIPKKGFALEKFFDLAIPLAEAISSAHEQGITHRDLKPANIMVTPDGRVDILDFGLAKLRPQVTEERTTQMPVSSLTNEGQIVGTVAYMSPEQAEGRYVDHRTDIFSLGIILYEMVTGQRPFKGETRVALMSSIMKDTPTSVRELSPQVPNHLGRIIRRSLEKDPERRFQTVKDLRNELADLKREIESGIMAPRGSSNRKQGWLWPSLSGALGAALATIVLVNASSGEEDGPKVIDNQQLTNRRGNQRWPSIKPNGDLVIFQDSTTQAIYQQRVRGGMAAQLIASSSNDNHPAFSSDGEFIAFSSDRGGRQGIYVMGATGENLHLEVEGGYHPQWSPDGSKLAYTDRNVNNPLGFPSTREIWIYDRQTRKSELISGDKIAFAPSWSPHGIRIAFCVRSGSDRDLWTVRSDGQDFRQVTRGTEADWAPFWSPDGRYLYFVSDRNGKADLWAVRIDEQSGEPLDDPRLIWSPTKGLVSEASISRDGQSIVCTVEQIDSEISRSAFDLDAAKASEPESIYYQGNAELTSFDRSPDGQWLSFYKFRGREDVFVLRTDDPSGGPLNLTDDPWRDREPAWYPNRDDEGLYWLTFFSDRPPIGSSVSQGWQIVARSPSVPDRLQLTTAGAMTHRWAPGGRRLMVLRDGGGGNVWLEMPDGIRGEPVDVWSTDVQTGQFTSHGSWSPNGELVAETPSAVWDGAGGALHVFFANGSEAQVALDSENRPYRVLFQRGNRWLDDDRLIFWDVDLRKAFLWSVREKTATPIDGIEEPGSFVVSPRDKTIFALRQTRSSDIWLLTLDQDSIE